MSEARFDEPDVDVPVPETAEAPPTPDPAPAEPVSPEPAAAVVEEEVEEVKPVPTVPLSALNEARHQTRELKQQLAAQQEQLKGLMSLKEQLEELRKSGEPSFKEDPLGALHRDITDLKKQQHQATSAQAQERAQAEERET